MTARKRNVYLGQINNTYGANAFLPYSTALLQAYAQSIPAIQENFDFKELLFLREPPEQVVARLEEPAVLALSSYIWNWQWNVDLARVVKQSWLECKVVLGGPQVLDRCERFFHEHPYVDILVHNEGELTFADILLWLADPTHGRDLSEIKGISYQGLGRTTHHTPPRERLNDLSVLPSPYLTGVFNEVLASYPHLSLHSTSETHRGCPYSCTFCDWGSAVFTKVRPFSEERVKAEYDWMSAHRIEMVYNADANFGLLPRDEALTDYLISLKEQTNWPQQIRLAWAKNSNEKIFRIASKLHEAQMDKGVTLALQSMNPATLKAIKRTNIPMDSFAELVAKYQKAGIPTYTELIMGLPEETYDTWADGIDEVLNAGHHNGLNIYLCILLPNSEMSDPNFILRYGIESVRTPVLQNHSMPDPSNAEYYDVVIGTSSMTKADWFSTYMFSWMVQTFHTMGLTQDISIWANRRGVSYRQFYERLFHYFWDRPGPIGYEVSKIATLVHLAMQGQEWGQTNERYGNISWPFEEFSYLNLVSGDPGRLYDDIATFLERDLNLPDQTEIINYQQSRLRTPEDFGQDLETFAREIAWYGRKGGFYLKEPVGEFPA
jgi:radical SAM superfamily enzyme YgiQ (UPF0313 family)